MNPRTIADPFRFPIYKHESFELYIRRVHTKGDWHWIIAETAGNKGGFYNKAATTRKLKLLDAFGGYVLDIQSHCPYKSDATSRGIIKNAYYVFTLI